MFIWSVRASSVKFFAIVVLTLIVFAGVILMSNTALAASAADADFSNVKTEEDRISFSKDCGVDVGALAGEVTFVMPENFDRVMLGYNDIQKRQGLDLSKYARKKVTRYTYTVEGYGDYEGTVYANLLICRNRIIGCDISSADPEGFVEPLVK